jgi:RNA polymerase-interacting CarD/CdnL/TRCF family regulator
MVKTALNKFKRSTMPFEIPETKINSDGLRSERTVIEISNQEQYINQQDKNDSATKTVIKMSNQENNNNQRSITNIRDLINEKIDILGFCVQ